MSDDSDERKEFVLAALRVGSMRAKLIESEINSIGIALKGDMINCYTAMQWVKEAGILDFVRLIPTKEEAGPALGSDV